MESYFCPNDENCFIGGKERAERLTTDTAAGGGGVTKVTRKRTARFSFMVFPKSKSISTLGR